MARRMIPAKLEGQLQKFNSNISEDGKLYLDGIVDADGNQRFIEGDITIETIEGITQTYGKWSLSGSHLLIVVACDVLQNTPISNSLRLANFNLPQWIYDKIKSIYGYGGVDSKTLYFYSKTTTSSVAGTSKLLKDNNILMVVIGYGGNIPDEDRAFRVSFDLLIDSEQAGE